MTTRPREPRGVCRYCGIAVPESCRYSRYCSSSHAVLAGRYGRRWEIGLAPVDPRDHARRTERERPVTRNPASDPAWCAAQGWSAIESERRRAQVDRLIAEIDRRPSEVSSEVEDEGELRARLRIGGAA